MSKCKVEWCSGKIIKDGMCYRHWKQVHRHGHVFRSMYDPNEIIIERKISRVIMRNRKGEIVGETVIDTEDIPKIKKYKWRMTNGYIKSGEENLQMSRIIMNPPNNMEVDHIDRNPLNNQKSNLRICTRSQNQMNTRSKLNGTSKYKGVHWNTRRKVWIAKIKINSATHQIGQFKSEIEAARAYNERAIELFGEFAKLNPIKTAVKEREP